MLDEVIPPTTQRLTSAAAGINWLFDNFNYERHTLLFVGKKNGKNHSPVRVYDAANREKALKDALQFNTDGYDVYFMVNEGDGIIHEGKKTPRSHESVTQLSKLFIDTDNCPLSKVQEYLFWIDIHPHAIIQSSPNKYHLHFFIDPVEKSSHNIAKWKAIQGMFHRLGDPSIKNPSESLGLDSTMSDFAKVLRVPGFFHIAKKAEVIITEEQDLPPYTLNDIFTATKAQEFLDYNKETHGTLTPSHVPSLTDTEIIQSGGRFAALQSLALHLANSNAPYNDKLGTFTLFARVRLDNADGAYVQADGTITEKAISLFNSAVSKVDRESQHASISDIQQGPQDNTQSSWHLPDEFYLSAPNGFGNVVKQVMDFSLYPCAAISFGVFLSGLSILKAKTHLTPGGSSPALYMLHVAPAGYGKADPMVLLQNMFVNSGMRKLISNEIRSDRGLYNHLESNSGLGMFILDEVAPLFKCIQKKDANSHQANISKALLQLFSAGSLKGLSLGKLASSSAPKGEQEIVLDNPMLALCGFTVPSEFYSMFTSDSIAKGLFQRFIPIVPEIKYVEENPNANREGQVSSDLFASFIEAQEIDSEGNPVEPLQTGTRTRMQYTPEAAAFFSELAQGYRHKLIEYAQSTDTEALSGLYSRLAEQVERVATVLSPQEIDLPTVKWAAAFIESRHKATLAMFESGLIADTSVGGRSLMLEEKVLKTLADMAKNTKDGVVFKSDVYKRVRKSFRDIREYDQVVSDMGQLQKIEIVRNYRQPNHPTGSAGTGLRLGNVLED